MSLLMPLRVVLFYLLLAGSALVWGVLMLLLAPMLSYQWRYKLIVGVWSRLAVLLAEHIVGIRYQLLGQENIPQQAGVILANHQSTWETFFLQQVFRPQTQLIKKELLYVPFFGWAFSLVKPIAIDRSKGRDSLKQLSSQGGRRLAEGIWILVFPEGTRVLPGSPIKFSRGGAALACANMAPVVPVAHNAGEFWPKVGWGKRPGTVTVMIGPALYPKGSDPRSIVELNKRAEEWVNEALLSMRSR
jgi:1-acyl-sn-glycerol-3-phosphate acyltransferase